MAEYIIRVSDEPDIMGNYALKEKPKELVRCKDCKWNSGNRNFPYCQTTSKGHEPDWFCADGEKKT